MFTAEERQKAFEDGYKMGAMGGKTWAIGCVKFALDRAYIKLGERNTLDEVQKEALQFLEELFAKDGV